MIRKKLIDGHRMTCPRCKNPHDILQYTRMQTVEEYELELTPIYKCPSCKFMFAPAGEMDHQIYEKLYQEMQGTLKSILERVNE